MRSEAAERCSCAPLAGDRECWADMSGMGGADLRPCIGCGGMVPDIHVIGDAAKPGKIMAAVEQAADLARKL